MNVLVVSCHPDDELLGAGGTIARHARRGDEVVLAIVCEGISMRYDPVRHEEVRRQADEAGRILGAREVVHCDLPDQKLDTLPLSDVIGVVEGLVNRVSPETIYTHFGGDVNRDHQVLSEAVLVAARPYAAPGVKEILMFETPSSTEWGSPTILPPFQPSVFVDVSETIDAKVDAFLRYTAEVRPWPHPRSPEALRERARYWGSLVNRRAAEPFVPVRLLR